MASDNSSIFPQFINPSCDVQITTDDSFFFTVFIQSRYRHEYKTYNTKTNFSKYSLGCKTFDLYPSVGKKLESFNTKQQIQQKVVSLVLLW